jgi:hypothetical protein
MIPTDFLVWLKNQVAEVASKYGVADHRAFPSWALSFLYEMDADDAFNQTDTLSQGDAGIDGWYFDQSAGVFHLVQAKYLSDPVNSVASGLEALLKAELLLRNPESIQEGVHASKLHDLSELYSQILLDEVTISFDFIVAGRITDQSANELNVAISTLGPNYTSSWIDTAALYEQHLTDLPIEDLAGQVVDFRLSGPSDYYKRNVQVIPGVAGFAVATIDGKSLGDMVSTFHARLFHGNIRYFLKKSNKINKSMLNTLNTDAGRNAFWLYNNGITVVVQDFSFIEENGVAYLRATNPQIVNGAQTSSVLKEKRSSLEFGQVSVQAKIISVSISEDGKRVLSSVSEYTNSQSPVKISDLRSNDRRQIQLQAAFSTVQKKVFYERRRGEWNSLEPAQRAPFQNRKVSKEDVGQRYFAFIGNSAKSVVHKNCIFENPDEQKAFDPSISAHAYLLAYELYERAAYILSTKGEAEMRQIVPAMFNPILPNDPNSPLLIASLRRSASLVATHAIALSRQILIKRYSQIGGVRAATLRERFASGITDGTYKFVWSQSFRAIRQWAAGLPDKSAVKSLLQNDNTLSYMSSNLEDNLADVNLTQILPNISNV